MVDAPKGYHWMLDKGRYYLMPNPEGGFKPHDGASLQGRFRLYQSHSR